MTNGNLLYAQSGGVTAVINATAAGVIGEARARKIKVLAARNGILGALREELIDTSKESAAAIAALAQTPAARSAPAATSSNRWSRTAPNTSACWRCCARTTCAGSSTTAATTRPIPH